MHITTARTVSLLVVCALMWPMRCVAVEIEHSATDVLQRAELDASVGTWDDVDFGWPPEVGFHEFGSMAVDEVECVCEAVDDDNAMPPTVLVTPE
jgi:hypothetical protein